MQFNVLQNTVSKYCLSYHYVYQHQIALWYITKEINKKKEQIYQCVWYEINKYI